MKTTEVSVSFSDAQEAIDLSPLGANGNRHHSVGGQSLKPYSVTISATPALPPNSTTSRPSTPTTKPTMINRASGIFPLSPSEPVGHPQALVSTSGNHSSGNNKAFSRRKATYDAHTATWSYTKCALLFFTAMLVTWIPSSANRVYSVVHSGNVCLPLEYMSAFVLPLQGFWNALIYMTTSWKACKMLWEDVCSSFKQRGAPAKSEVSCLSLSTGPALMNAVDAPLRSPSRLQRVMGRADPLGVGPSGRAGHHFQRSSKSSETESMEELANVSSGQVNR